MDRQTAQLFFATLTMFVLLGTALVLLGRVVANRSRAVNDGIAALGQFANPLAASVAVISMLGSLYFSEVAGYLPCTLCWYQRIAMYPLGLMLTIASFRRDRSIRWYVVPLASVGAAISLYHWLLERFPDLDAGVCSVTVPCEFVWFEEFGFVTLPFMALVGFVAVIVVTTLPSSQTDAVGTGQSPSHDRHAR